MSTPFTGAGLNPDAFASAAARFFDLLRGLAPPAAGGLPDAAALAAPLARQFEQWLRLTQSAGPWFSSAGAAPAGLGAAAAFGPLPLGPAAVGGGEAQRVMELLARLAQLHGQLASHWSEIAQTAAQRFTSRFAMAGTATPGVDQALRLYELWVNCAEEAYAAS